MIGIIKYLTSLIAIDITKIVNFYRPVVNNYGPGG